MRALLYAPELTGHPQVYLRVIARALLNAGHEVTVAGPANKQEWMSSWPVLRVLADVPRVQACDTRRVSGQANGYLTAEQLLQVQRETRADTTLLIEADKFADEFRRIAANNAPRLRGRVCAIFARTAEWYPGEDSYTGQVEPLVGPTMRRTLGRARRWLFDYRDSPRFFFEKIIIARGLVDALIVKDERLPVRFGPPVQWMPEIYRVFDIQEEERRREDWYRFAEPIMNAIEEAGADRVLLYFGTGAWYKGYDWFLKLAHDDPAAFVLHAGAPDRQESSKPYDYDVAQLRAELIRQGRMFETNAYVESEDLVSLLFSRIARFVSTHRLTMSSGTLLQALEAGKPVLNAGTGLIGWRVREFGIGATYPYRNAEGLLSAWLEFREGKRDPQAEKISTFMRRYSREATESFFVGTLTAEGGNHA